MRADKKLNLHKLFKMTQSLIRKKLHQFIDALEDKKAVAIYTLLENEIDIDAQRKKIIFIEREKYLNGEDKSYSWNDVKEMATDKRKRRGL